MSNSIQNAMRLALEKAKAFEGATAPNPPVGAAGLDIHGKILSVQAHEKAGAAHAEAKVIDDCENRKILHLLHTLVITLEPCNHIGKTGACTRRILNTPTQRVVYGVQDPNPHVQGHGAETLLQAGLEVIQLKEFQNECKSLIQPFSHWIKTGRPWITLKTAYDETGSMIPPTGQKTFTSENSLIFAHQLRKKADAILTGSGTILADQPEFTVRKVQDHPSTNEKKRWLVYMDRRERVSKEWVEKCKKRGFLPYRGIDLNEVIQDLGKKGVLEILVEAGPTLSKEILEKKLWNTHVKIMKQNATADQIEIICSQES